MNGYDAFERAVKQAVEPYEVPYNSADWAQLEKLLDERPTVVPGFQTGVYALLIGGTLALASALYLMLGPDGDAGRKAIPTTVEEELHHPAAETAGETLAAGGSDRLQGHVGPTATASPAATPAPRTIAAPTGERGTPPASPASSGQQATAPAALSNEIVIKPNITEGCPGTTVDFAVSNVPEGGIHLWNFGDGSFSNKPAPSHTYTKSGSFLVTLSYSSVGGGNFHNKPAPDRIVIHEAPEASFKWIRREYENTIPSVHFENRSIGDGTRTYHWDFGDGSTSNVAHPDHVYKNKGTYTVVLSVTNAKGCTDRYEQIVRIDSDYNLNAATTFSPNADGVDDTFLPEALRTLGVKFSMSIFNKGGELIYETTDAQRPWNGRVGNRGDLCASGEYLWVVEMKDGEKLGGTYTGKVSLVR